MDVVFMLAAVIFAFGGLAGVFAWSEAEPTTDLTERFYTSLRGRSGRICTLTFGTQN